MNSTVSNMLAGGNGNGSSTSDAELFVYVFSFVVNTVAGIILTYIVFGHSIYLYQDIHTVERKSVSHRRIKPEVTKMYKYLNIITYISMLTAAINIWCNIGGWLSPTPESCKIAMITQATGVISKMCVPVIYSLRLHLVYDGTQYEYKIWKIKTVTGITLTVLIFFIIMWIYAIATMFSKEYKNDDITNLQWSIGYEKTKIFYSVCDLTIPDIYITLYSICDLGVNLGFTIAFVRPIRDVIKKVQGSTRNINDKSKMNKKMLFVGFKVALLSGVLFISSLLTVLIFGIFGFVLFPTDACVNSICLALMTAYYPDTKYYQKYCKCCILCCDKKGYSKGKANQVIDEMSPKANEPTVTEFGSDMENQSGQSENPTNGVSADTMSQVRLAAKDHARAPLENNNDPQIQLGMHLAQNQQ